MQKRGSRCCFSTWLFVVAVVFMMGTFGRAVAGGGNWLYFSDGSVSPVTDGRALQTPEMVIDDQGTAGIRIDYTFTGGVINTRDVEGETYTTVVLDHFGHMAEVGKPAVPQRVYTVAVPPGTRAEVELLDYDTEIAGGYRIHPALEPATDTVGGSEPEFAINQLFYARNVTYPTEPVTIIDTRDLRGTQLALVRICPVQYNPALDELTLYSRLSFRINFTPRLFSFDAVPSTQSPLLPNIIINSSAVNAPQARVMAGEDVFSSLLIVTNSEFDTAAEALAEWKRQMGYTVFLESRSLWSAVQVKSTIHGYTNLDFFVIIGDHDDVPSELVGGHVTDLYYACTGGTGDFVPDMGYGRISVSSALEAQTVVDKIIGYERTPVSDPDFYTSGMTAAYFQHAGSGYAQRRFAQTSWEIRQYLTGQHGYDIDRIFYTESYVNPLYWNNGKYSSGEPIPDYLRRPNYSWDGNAAQISAGINAGRFMVFHRDHGDLTLWGDPYYTTSHISQLTNGNKLPVVFSINCLTGKFDQNSFSEVFLRHPNGGAVGVIGATELSTSGNNDGMAEGLVDAIWPDPGLVPLFPHNTSPAVTPHAAITQMGLVLNQGKMRMSETWGGGTPPHNYEQLSYELFHYFGDPTMRIRTGVPRTIAAAHPAVVMVAQNSLTVSAATCAQGVATLMFDGEVIGRGNLSGGAVTMGLDPVPTTLGTAVLTITAAGCRPYQAALEVIPGGPALIPTAPAGGALFDVGDSLTVTWQTFEPQEIQNVIIEFSSDNGSSFATVAASVPNIDSYTMTAPDVDSEQCLVRVADADDGDPFGVTALFAVRDLSEISGQVYGPGMAGQITATVSYSGPDSGSVMTALDGTYAIQKLLPGTYTLSSAAGGYRSGDQIVTVPPDADDVDFTINYPVIDVQPDSIDATVEIGASAVVPLTIYNTGDAVLEFEIAASDVSEVVPAEDIYDESHFVSDLGSEENPLEDNRVGLSVTDGKGGPDNFGYTWIDSDEPAGPVFVWEDISATGILLNDVSVCNGCYEEVNLSFDFPFYGNEYGSVFVDDNGYVSPGSIDHQSANYPLPSNSAPQNIIAGFWNNLSPQNNGSVYYQDFGNRVIIQYENVYNHDGGGYVTFQMVLNQNGKIVFYYKTMSGTLTSATIGIQNQSKNDGFTIAYNTSYVYDGLAIEIKSTPDWLMVTPEMGSVAPGATATVQVGLDAVDMLGGEYVGQLELTHNDPFAAEPLVVPVNLTVDGERKLSVAPLTHDFGQVWVGDTPEMIFELENSGNEATTISAITVTDNRFAVNGALPIVLDPFESRPLSILFSPDSVGAFSADLIIDSDAEDNPRLEVEITGAGTPGPEIAVSPEAIDELIESGDSRIVPLTIQNTGAADLKYLMTAIATVTTTSISAEQLYDAGHFVALEKEAEDVREGLPVTDGSAGPDGFGYRSMDSNAPGGPPYVWDDIAVLANRMATISTCDDCFEEVLLSFSFSHYGIAYDSLFVGSNGYITFGAGSDESTNYPLPTGSAPSALVAGFYDDLDPAEGGTVYFKDYGDRAVVQFDDVVPFGSAAGYTFQMVLKSDGSIRFYYKDMAGPLDSATIGIQNHARDDGLNIVYNYAYIEDDFAIAVWPETDWITVTPTSGKITPNTHDYITVDLDTIGLLGGVYRRNIHITHNAPLSASPLIVPVTMTVDGFKMLAVQPESLDFGSIWAGTTTSLALTLTNDGDETTTVSRIAGSSSAVTCSETVPFTLTPFTSRGVEVTFAPDNVGTLNGTLTIESDAEDNPVITVPVNGVSILGPVAGVSPSSITAVAVAGGTVEVPLSISNSGGADMEVHISSSSYGQTETVRTVAAEEIYDASHFVEFEDGEEDTREGLPVLEGSGGPDTFGYEWIDSDEPAGPEFVWVDIASTGTELTKVSSGSVSYEEVSLSFSFPFYENDYASLFVGRNGYVTFGSGSTRSTNYPLPSTSAPQNLIAGFYDSLSPASAGHVYYQDFGSRIVIQYDDVYRSGGRVTFQIVLQQNGKILLYYKTMTGTLTSATIGIQNNARNDGLTVAYNTAYVHDELAVEITAGPTWMNIVPDSVLIPPSTTAEMTVTMDAGGLYAGEYEAYIQIDHDDPLQTSPLEVPVSFTVEELRSLSVIPQIDFGTVRSGVTETMLLEFVNAGNAPTTVSDIGLTVNESFGFYAAVPMVIPPFDSADVPVGFRPDAVGEHSDILVIESDADDNPYIEVSLTGEGIVGPVISIDPSEITESVAAGGIVEVPVTIINSGDETLDLTIATSTTDSSAKSRQNISRPVSSMAAAAADPSEGFGVTAEPPHEMISTYPFFDGFESGNYNNWSAGSGTYTREVTSATAASGTYSFSQTGGSSGHYSGVSAAFTAAQTPEVVSFSVRSASTSSSDGYFVLRNGNGTAIFFFMTGGGRMYINENQGFQYAANSWYDIRFDIDWLNQCFDFYVNGALEASNLSFRDRVIALETVYLYNFNSNSQAWYDNINIGGEAPSAWMSAAPVSLTIPPSSSAELTLTLDASELAAGEHQGALQINHNASNQPSPIEVPVTLTVEGVKKLSAEPLSIDFGSVAVGMTGTVALALANDGNEATTVSDIVSSNATVFSHDTALPLIVPAFGTVAVVVIFTPQDHVDYAEELIVASDASDNPIITVAVTGRGDNQTLVELSGFTAEAGDREVLLVWETAAEVDNAGFNLYRALPADGEYERINFGLIPAEGSAFEGASYLFVDDTVRNGWTYYYILEDIDLNGAATRHGPVRATPRRMKFMQR